MNAEEGIFGSACRDPCCARLNKKISWKFVYRMYRGAEDYKDVDRDLTLITGDFKHFDHPGRYFNLHDFNVLSDENHPSKIPLVI
jgi:hypothetical protein